MADKLLNPIDLPTLAVTPTNPQPGFHRFYAKTNGRPYSLNSNGDEFELNDGKRFISFGINSNSVITPGNKRYIKIPFDITITGWDIISLNTGSVEANISFTQAPYNDIQNMTDDNFIFLNNQKYNSSADLSAWNVDSLSNGDILIFSVISGDITNFNINVYFKLN